MSWSMKVSCLGNIRKSYRQPWNLRKGAVLWGFSNATHESHLLLIPERYLLANAPSANRFGVGYVTMAVLFWKATTEYNMRQSFNSRAFGAKMALPTVDEFWKEGST